MATGTITFATAIQAALFQHEIKGQLSDGYWENTMPMDHWKFWSGLDVAVGTPGVAIADTWYYGVRKNNYGLTRLIEYVGDRMVEIGLEFDPHYNVVKLRKDLQAMSKTMKMVRTSRW